MKPLPLLGRRILVTRALHQAGRLSDGLRALGAEPVEVPVIMIVVPESYEPLDDALLHLDRYDWLILTSANAVRAFVERAWVLEIDARHLTRLTVAAVGEPTAVAARKAGLQVAFVPKAYMAETLAEGLLARAAGQRILLARAAVARDVIPNALREAGVEVDVVDAYRNVLPEAAPEQLRQALAKGIDVATFTSSSSATHLAEAARVAGVAWPFAGVAAVSIGPITSRTLWELGWECAGEARPFDVSGLIASVVRVLSG
ncbi:MAG: uroporphyrinogen-III synthase [Terracidiphilus sp.]